MSNIQELIKYFDEDNCYPVLADSDCIYREKLVKENWAGEGIHAWSISFNHSSGPMIQFITLKADEIGKKFPNVIVYRDYQGVKRKHILITKKHVIENPELKKAYIILYKLDNISRKIQEDLNNKSTDDLKQFEKEQLKRDIIENMMMNN